MSKRKNFMAHINRRHRNLSSTMITLAMKQSFPIFDCYCGRHCIGHKGLTQHVNLCTAVRPAGWIFPPLHPSFPVAPAAAAIIMDEIMPAAPDLLDEDCTDFEDLLARYRMPVYTVHYTWKEPSRRIVEDLLSKSISLSEIVANRNIAALNLFPGLLMLHNHRKKGDGLLSPINWLRTVLAQPDFSVEIIRFARADAAKPRPPTPPASEWKAPTTEWLRTRAVHLMKHGRLRAACQTIDRISLMLEGKACPEPLNEIAAALRIASLHPANNEMDVLPLVTEDPQVECLQITPDQLRNKVYELSFDSAAGNTGWSNLLIYALCNDRSNPGFQPGLSPPLPIIEAFCALGNKMLRGEITGVGRDLLVGARLNLIDKPDGGSRPIRIECACRRWFSTTACGVAMRTIGPLLRPLQLGGGLSHGAGIGARRAGEYFQREGFSVLSVDIENAFNSTRHRVIYDALLTYCPSLIPFFRFKYGSFSNMRNNQGVLVARTRTGVGQGDPWGSLFFEVAIQGSLLRTQEALRRIEDSMDISAPGLLHGRKGTVLAFEDDTSAMADTRVIFELAPLLEDIFATDGFVVKVAKSTITGSDVDRIASEIAEPAGFRLSTEGITTLGVAIGTRDFRRSTAKTKLAQMLPTIKALLLMGPRIATSLLLQCYNLRPLFIMASAIDPDDIIEYARTLDEQTAKIVAAILRTEVTDTLEYRCFLPPQLGGLGLIRHGGMSTEKAQITQRLAYTEFVLKYYPAEYINIIEQNLPVNIQLGAYEGLEDKTELTQLIMEGLSLRSCRNTLGIAKRAAERTHSDSIQDGLQSVSLNKAAWMLSCSASSLNFIKSNRGISNERLLSNDQFRCALQAKLGANPLDLRPDKVFTCQCGKDYCPEEDPYHGMSCHMTAFFRSRRHTEIQKALHDYAKRCLDLADGAIEWEPYAGETQANDHEGARSVHADISLIIGGEKLWIDVAIVDPGARSYMDRHRSYSTQDAASKAMEAHKRLHYQAIRHPAPLPPSTVIPFTVEASGRLGPAALGFLERIGGTHTFLRSQLLNDISLITAIHMGKMLMATREWMTANPQNWEA